MGIWYIFIHQLYDTDLALSLGGKPIQIKGCWLSHPIQSKNSGIQLRACQSILLLPMSPQVSAWPSPSHFARNCSFRASSMGDLCRMRNGHGSRHSVRRAEEERASNRVPPSCTSHVPALVVAALPFLGGPEPQYLLQVLTSIILPKKHKKNCHN